MKEPLRKELLFPPFDGDGYTPIDEWTVNVSQALKDGAHPMRLVTLKLEQVLEFAEQELWETALDLFTVEKSCGACLGYRNQCSCACCPIYNELGMRCYRHPRSIAIEKALDRALEVPTEKLNWAIDLCRRLEETPKP